MDAKGKKSPVTARRMQVANACVACRGSKVKCSGKHPTCARCRSRGIDCTFDVSEEGMTKRQHLRQELQSQKEGLERATAVLHMLQNGTDFQATELLACLRIGQSVDEVYQYLRSQGLWSPQVTPRVAGPNATRNASDNSLQTDLFTAYTNNSPQSLASPTATSEHSSGWQHAQQIDTTMSQTPTAMSHRPSEWPYPSADPSEQTEEAYLSHWHSPETTEDDGSQDPSAVTSPTSPSSMCSPTTQLGAQEPFAETRYTREQLFFESTPRDVINRGLTSTMPWRKFS